MNSSQDEPRPARVAPRREAGTLPEVPSQVPGGPNPDPRDPVAVVDAVPAPPKDVLQIANSRLVVVRSILIAWDLEGLIEPAGYSLHYVELPWTEALLRAVAECRLHFAIFNHLSAREYCANNANDPLVSLGIFGYSMGGKNFCVIASRQGSWGGIETDTFLENPNGAVVCVGIHSDRYRNLLKALALTEDELHERGIRLINIPEPTLEVFETDPDALLVGGQNTRFEALRSGKYFELVRYEALDETRRAWFRESAANTLVASTPMIADLHDRHVDDLFAQLRRNFYANWHDPRQFRGLLDRIINECEFGAADPQEREFVARHVLYETYRIGEPVW
jgi:hypothetical protein